MKVAYLAPANSTHSRRWLRHLEAAGDPVLWMSIDRPLRETMADLSENVTYVELSGSRRPLTILKQIHQVRSLVNEFSADVLHVHSMGRYGLVGAAVSIPTVMTAWGSDIVLASGLKRLALRWMIRRSAALTCDAHHLRDALIGLGAAPDQIHLVYFGVEVHEFDALPAAERRTQRRRLGIPEGPVVISLRSLEPIYDLETLLRAMAVAASVVPSITCLLVGDGTERGRLESLSRSLGISPHIRFLGRLFLDEVRTMLQVADVYVSTALSDGGLAASTAEAMASRLPVIVTDAAENRLWVEPGENGWLFPPGDHRALAELLLEVLGDPHTAARAGARARATIEERNNVAIEMAKAATILRDVVT